MSDGTHGLAFQGKPADDFQDDDRRQGQRYTLLLRTAKFVADGMEHLCIIREASDSGVKIQLFNPVPEAASFALEMPNGDLHPIAFIWSKDDVAGFRFHRGIDLAQFIQASASESARKYVRLQKRMQGTLTVDGQIIPISFANISQQGACIECSASLAIDQLVAIDMGVLTPTFAKVRWRNRPQYGLIFEQIYRFEELARKLGFTARP